MPSPFPGMDPYLERFWLSVHNTLVTYLRDDLNARLLPPDLRAEMTERVLISSPDESYRRRILPDVYVVENASTGAAGADPATALARGAGGVAVAEPVVVRVDDEPAVETALHITDLTGATLITAVEFLSASNKLAGRDREQYLRKRDEYHAGGASTVEIDLFRGGERTVPGIDDHLPAGRRSPYLVITRRSRRPNEWLVYPLPLRSPPAGLPHPPAARGRRGADRSAAPAGPGIRQRPLPDRLRPRPRPAAGGRRRNVGLGPAPRRRSAAVGPQVTSGQEDRTSGRIGSSSWKARSRSDMAVVEPSRHHGRVIAVASLTHRLSQEAAGVRCLACRDLLGSTSRRSIRRRYGPPPGRGR